MSRKEYARLRKALLSQGLADLGVVEERGLLLLSSEECVGGFEFQKSKYSAFTFFVNVGVMSRVLHQFNLEATPRPDDYEKLPWELKCPVRGRLESLPGEGDCPSQWRIEGPDSIESLAVDLGRQLRERGAPFVQDRLSNEAILTALETHETDLAYHAREAERCVHRAVLNHHLGRTSERDAALSEAREAAGRDTSWVEDRAQQLVDPVSPLGALEGLDPRVALERLKEITGQDFGDDMEAWQTWLRENRG